MTTWNANFEAQPADSDNANDGANQIRILKTAISERLELEMNFKTGTQPLIKAGVASVCYYANVTAINALANCSNHALAYNTSANRFYTRQSGNWVALNPTHSYLSGLANDDHAQYLHLDKLSQTILQNVAVAANKTIDGVDISAHAGGTATAQHTGGIGNSFGAWDSANFTWNTTYTSTTDGIVVASIPCTVMSLYSPYTVGPVERCFHSQSSNAYSISMTCPVRKGDTWRIVAAGVNGTSGKVSWMPLGS